jgi:hypothetical protein
MRAQTHVNTGRKGDHSAWFMMMMMVDMPLVDLLML